jgi:hypothetical protein
MGVNVKLDSRGKFFKKLKKKKKSCGSSTDFPRARIPDPQLVNS